MQNYIKVFDEWLYEGIRKIKSSLFVVSEVLLNHIQNKSILSFSFHLFSRLHHHSSKSVLFIFICIIKRFKGFYFIEEIFVNLNLILLLLLFLFKLHLLHLLYPVHDWVFMNRIDYIEYKFLVRTMGLAVIGKV